MKRFLPVLVLVLESEVSQNGHGVLGRGFI